MSAWKDFSTAALLGTGKGAPPALPSQLQVIAGETAALSDEARFLTQAGALALWRRAGWQPSASDAETSPCEAETTAPLGRASVGHLRAMISGSGAGVLPEWLAEAARLGRHLPPEYLPALLDRARQDRSLRPLVLTAGGRRALWLAAQNPDWSFAPSEAPDAWETGSRDQRVAVLRTLRTSEPAEARIRIEAVWKTEPAELRAAFLAEFATRLSEEDAPFLDSTLDDRSKEVRRVAVDLLARLPASPFVARMIARAAPLLAFQRGGILSRASLEVTLPPDPDPVAVRDGLDPKAFGQQKVLGDKAVLLVLILSAVPLRHWTETFGKDPTALLKAAEKSEFARALATGWSWAAWRQRDATWAAALLDGPVRAHSEFLPTEPLLTLLPEAERAARLTAHIRAGAMGKAGSDLWIGCLTELAGFAGRAPASLVKEALAELRASVAGGLPWHYRPPVEAWLLRLPAAQLSGAAAGWPAGQEGIDALVDLINFRHDALTALTQP